MSIEKVKDLLKDFANPKKWELLGGHYYRCKGKSKTQPYKIVEQVLTELETAEGNPESCVGTDMLREIAEQQWAESCEPKRHVLKMADEFDKLLAESKSKPEPPEFV